MEKVTQANAHFYDFLFDWESKYYLLIGGYGSSKSYHVAMKIIAKLTAERRTCLVVREVYGTMRDSCYALFVDICSSMNLSDNFVTFTRLPLEVNFFNGSKIIFRGMDKPEKLKSIHDVSLIWIEESSEISYSGFKELIGRLRHPHLPLHMILSTNPTSKSNWVYKHFVESRHIDEQRLYSERIMRVDDCYYHHSTVLDNAFIPDDYRAELDKIKTYDGDLYRIARLGQFGDDSLLVLPQFEVANHALVMAAVDRLPRRFKFVGMDFGFVESYNAVVRCGVDNVNKWLYIYWEYYKRGMTDDETAADLSEFKLSRELIKCDSAEPKTIAYLRKQGLNATAAHKWNGGTRHARLDNLRKVKRFHRIICSDKCVNVVNELAGLNYAKDKSGNVISDEFNIDAHTLSAIWYALDNYDFDDLKYKISLSDFGL